MEFRRVLFRSTVPATVQTLISARIDRLDAADQALLSRAAVVGQTFSHALLARVVTDRREHLLGALNRLAQAGFLQRTRVVPHVEFSFKHALIHEVTYASLPRNLRKGIHTAVVAALRSRSLEIPNRLALLAQHCLRSEQWARAFVCGQNAGRDALRRSLHREAARLLEGAIEALAKFPRTPRVYRRLASARNAIRSVAAQAPSRSSIARACRAMRWSTRSRRSAGCRWHNRRCPRRRRVTWRYLGSC